MSNEIFPTLKGLTFPVGMRPTFSTNIKKAISGRELRRRNYAFSLVEFNLVFEFLRDNSQFNEFKTILSFFNARSGSFDSFLFLCPDDSSISNQLVGVGDGVNRSFQLVRDIGYGPEPVANIKQINQRLMWSSNGSTPMWSVDQATLMWTSAVDFGANDYTLSNTGLITFNTAPPLGRQILWSGQYYYRCRFLDDAQDFSKFMKQLWELKKLNMLGTLGTRI